MLMKRFTAFLSILRLLAVPRLNTLAGVKISRVPFTGTGDAMPPFLGGHISGLMTCTGMGVLRKSDARYRPLPRKSAFLRWRIRPLSRNRKTLAGASPPRKGR